MNYGLAHRDENKSERCGDASLLFHSNGSLLLRAITTDKYSRIWNYEVCERLLDLERRGWVPANKGPIAKWSQGQEISAPLYASDHDMFAFLVFPSVTIIEAGSTDPLYRGVIIENSEVGASALKLTRFSYREMCGNHIIWGASKLMEISVRHVGNASERFGNFAFELKRYSEESASDEEAKIASAKRVTIAATKEQVLDKLFGIRSLGLSRKALDAGYDAALPEQDGSPNTQWGIVQGLTRHSQTLQYADARTQLDRAAGKILEIEF